MTEDPGSESFSAAVRSEALDLVSDIQGWRMAPDRWQELTELLTAMEAALADDRIDDLAAIAARADLIRPLRIIRIGSTPISVPPPPSLQVRLDRLVYTLGGVDAMNTERGSQGSSRA